MKKIFAITGIGLWFAISASADVINFTEAEGYSAGQLRANANWSGTASDILVDPTGSGSVTNIGATAFRNMAYGSALGAGSSAYTVSTVISFDHLGTQTQSGNIITFGESFQHSDGMAFLLLTRLNSSQFRLAFFDQIASTTTINSDAIDGTALGLSGNYAEVSSTDLLKMSMTITRGVDENDWSVSASLENLDTATTLTTLSGSFDTTAAFFNDSVVTGFNSRALVSTADMSTITMHTFESIPEPASLGLLVIGMSGIGLVRKCFVSN